jgi:hypothetical protein
VNLLGVTFEAFGLPRRSETKAGVVVSAFSSQRSKLRLGEGGVFETLPM